VIRRRRECSSAGSGSRATSGSDEIPYMVVKKDGTVSGSIDTSSLAGC